MLLAGIRVSLKAASLWIHVLAGASCIGICGSFVLGSLALAGAATELREFAARSLPLLNRLAIGCACVIPVSGVINLTFAARAHGYALPRQFVVIVAVKLLLFTAMAWALAVAIGRSKAIGLNRDAELESPSVMRVLVPWYGLIVVLGATALALGLWLAGI
jgi:hypothetical protein